MFLGSEFLQQNGLPLGLVIVLLVALVLFVFIPTKD